MLPPVDFLVFRRGIYRLVQFPGTSYEDLFIAWLKTGPGAVISHDSALYLYKLSDVLPSEIHVIIPRTGSRRRKGIRLHTNRLDPDEVRRREGLPVTSTAVERSLMLQPAVLRKNRSKRLSTRQFSKGWLVEMNSFLWHLAVTVKSCI